VRDEFGLRESFTIDAASRQRLLEGKDEIDLILTHEPDIAAYERRANGLQIADGGLLI
jgi:3-isopropylmalate dehydratase small subunit